MEIKTIVRGNKSVRQRQLSRRGSVNEKRKDSLKRVRRYSD